MSGRAGTYADALYELARDEKLSEDIMAELTMAAGLFEANPQFVTLLALPNIPKPERLQLIDEAFGGRVHEYLLSFLKLLTENGLIRELPACRKVFRRRYNDDNGILEVTAITAAPLSDELAERLSGKLEKATGKHIDLTRRVDRTLIGGVRLEMDGKRYDGTVRARLDELQRSLDATVL